jgi:HAD superfamily hydrolase (TIGR01509 family)
MIKAVIFDMDGLMIDSEPIQSKSFEHVLKEHDKRPVFKNGVVQVVGITAKDNWKLLKEKHDIKANINVLLDKKRKIYRKLLQDNVSPRKGLISLVKRLHTAGIKMAIASSSSPKNIQTVLTGLGLNDYFDIAISGESVRRGKPYPDVFLKAAEKLGLPARSCAVLEDAESGVEAAHQARMKVIAIPNRFTRHHDLKKADLVLPSLDKITLKVIKGL